MDNPKKIYIAGPMSGLPEFNFPRFMNTAKRLRKDGWLVFNPAEKEEEKAFNKDIYKAGDSAAAIEQGFDFREVYMWDLEKVVTADAIYMLPGWEQSPGARGEHAVAVAMKKHYPEYKIIYETD
jgi:hypothetical protein